jgi:hypothetical protein
VAEDILLDAARRLEPLKQADLVLLCGLFSVLNAVRLALYPRELDRRQLRTLFRVGIAHLASTRSLKSTLEAGLDERRWYRLARGVLNDVTEQHGVNLRCEPILADCQRKDSEGAFATLERHLLAGNPILIGLWGVHQHYSVLSGISAARLTLFDSTGLHWIRRDRCSFMHSGQRLRHRISRHSVFAVVKNVPGEA